MTEEEARPEVEKRASGALLDVVDGVCVAVRPRYFEDVRGRRFEILARGASWEEVIAALDQRNADIARRYKEERMQDLREALNTRPPARKAWWRRLLRRL